jgi:hypothetical protein
MDAARNGLEWLMSVMVAGSEQLLILASSSAFDELKKTLGVIDGHPTPLEGWAPHDCSTVALNGCDGPTRIHKLSPSEELVPNFRFLVKSLPKGPRPLAHS